MHRPSRITILLAVVAVFLISALMLSAPAQQNRLMSAMKNDLRGDKDTLSVSARGSGQGSSLLSADGSVPVIPTGYGPLLMDHLERIFSIPGMPIDNMWSLGNALRLHLSLFVFQQQALASNSHSLAEGGVERLLANLLKQVYPWLKTSIPALQATFKPNTRGIVYTTGRYHAHFTYISILGLRQVGCRLPIQIVYGGENDLPKGYRDVLEMLDGVTTLDIHEKLNWNKAIPEGWAIKPFALLFSDFEEVMFVDSDVFFFQKPEVLFEDEGYQSTGSLFFHDRTLFPDANSPSHVWFKSLVPDPSENAQNLRHWKGITQHEQESGVVVVNKSRNQTAILGLLATCSWNAKLVREAVVYHKVHGDKETFWMSYEMAGQKYAFMPGNGGVVGFPSKALSKEQAVCGGLLHVDRMNRPLWFNGGLEVDKHNVPDLFINFTAFHVDPDAQGVSWRFPSKDQEGYCMWRTNENGAVPMEQLQEGEMNITQWLVNIERKLKSDVTLSKFWTGKL